MIDLIGISPVNILLPILSAFEEHNTSCKYRTGEHDRPIRRILRLLTLKGTSDYLMYD